MTDIIPAKYRKVAYQIYATIGVILGALQVAISALPDVHQPPWLVAALAVYAFVGTAVGLVAQANTPADVADPGE